MGSNANVAPAAANPTRSWRTLEVQRALPVTKVMAAPMKNRPSAQTANAVQNAVIPCENTNGRTGTIAPTAKRKKEAVAEKRHWCM